MNSFLFAPDTRLYVYMYKIFQYRQTKEISMANFPTETRISVMVSAKSFRYYKADLNSRAGDAQA